MNSTDVRSQLVYALRDDLIGPDSDDPRDAAHLTETRLALPLLPCLPHPLENSPAKRKLLRAGTTPKTRGRATPLTKSDRF